MTTLLKTLNFSSLDLNSICRVSEREQDTDLLDSKDEEISRLNNQIDILKADVKSKGYAISQLSEENNQLQEKNKKWVRKIDEEIEKNAEEVQSLNVEINKLKDANFKLKLELDTKQFFGKAEILRKQNHSLNSILLKDCQFTISARKSEK